MSSKLHELIKELDTNWSRIEPIIKHIRFCDSSMIDELFGDDNPVFYLEAGYSTYLASKVLTELLSNHRYNKAMTVLHIITNYDKEYVLTGVVLHTIKEFESSGGLEDFISNCATDLFYRDVVLGHRYMSVLCIFTVMYELNLIDNLSLVNRDGVYESFCERVKSNRSTTKRIKDKVLEVFYNNIFEC